MGSRLKSTALAEFADRYGHGRRLAGSQSLFEFGEGLLRVYFRYSTVHGGKRTFYGLRKEDLRQLEGYPSLICLLWDGQREPLFVPFAEYEEVFHSVEPAPDGQYKVQVFLSAEGTELYLARAGRFNVDGCFGWLTVDGVVDSTKCRVPELSHSQVQTLLGAIGAAKDFDVWIPKIDRPKLDRALTPPFDCCGTLPARLGHASEILSEVDVVWIQPGSGELRALYEVEHSTPVYSGLLRFNDIHLVERGLKPTYGIVANDERRALFVRQLNRPTFRASGLSECCTFMRYENVYAWQRRVGPPGERSGRGR
jgi:hypothetical protein